MIIIHKRYTDIDYIVMGRMKHWDINEVATMLAWFSLSERSYLNEYDEFVVYETEQDKGSKITCIRDHFKDPASKAFCEIQQNIYSFFYKVYLEDNRSFIEKQHIDDIMDQTEKKPDLLISQESALLFLETRYTDVNVEKLKKLLKGEIFTGKKDNIIERIIDKYGSNDNGSKKASSMAHVRHEKDEPSKYSLIQRIKDYFAGNCKCNSVTAFAEMKNAWPSEDAMKKEMKVGYDYLHNHIKKILVTLESKDTEGVVRRKNAPGYRKEKQPTSCPKHKKTLTK